MLRSILFTVYIFTELEQVIDSQHDGVPKHIGKIANEMDNWENVLLVGELGLKQADITQIKTKYPDDSKLQA